LANNRGAQQDEFVVWGARQSILEAANAMKDRTYLWDKKPKEKCMKE